jgi:MFS family permease
MADERTGEPTEQATPLSLKQQLKALPTPAWILFGGTFVNRFGTFVMPFLVIYLTRAGYTASQAGIALSSYGLGHVVAAMLGGHLADRIGRRFTIALSMFSSAVLMVALSQSRGLPAILTVMFLAGAAAELYRPAAAALIADLIPPDQRMFAFGMYRFAINLGFALGPATAGFLADRSFLYLFIGDAITSAVYGVVALMFLPQGLRSERKDESPIEGFRVAFRDVMFMRFLIASLCVTWIEYQTHSTLPLYITKVGHSAATYGLLVSINGVLIILFEIAITFWAQRFPPRPLIALGFALSGLGYALTGFATGIPALAATVVVWTLGEMIFAPATSTFVANIAPEQYRGRYNGLWVMTWSIGMVFGPVLGTWLFEYNEPALWISSAVMGFAGGALILLRPRTVPATA